MTVTDRAGRIELEGSVIVNERLALDEPAIFGKAGGQVLNVKWSIAESELIACGIWSKSNLNSAPEIAQWDRGQCSGQEESWVAAFPFPNVNDSPAPK